MSNKKYQITSKVLNEIITIDPFNMFFGALLGGIAGKIVGHIAGSASTMFGLTKNEKKELAQAIEHFILSNKLDAEEPRHQALIKGFTIKAAKQIKDYRADKIKSISTDIGALAGSIKAGVSLDK